MSRRLLDPLRLAAGRLLESSTASGDRPALPTLAPTHGPFADRAEAEDVRTRLTREHLGFLNSQRGHLALEQGRDGAWWVVRHLGRPRLRDRALRWLDVIPPLP